MATISFYARGVNTNAGNQYLNVRPVAQVPVTELVFVQATSPVSLDYMNGAPDPDTQLFINNVEYSFIVRFSGSLPNDSKYADVNGVDLRGVNIVVVTASNGVTYVFPTDPNVTFLTMLAFPGGGSSLDGYTTSGDPIILCFAKGTWIATPYGERRVESLVAGDLVTTLDGRAVPLRWIAHGALSQEELAAQPDLWPVRIAKGHFGADMPNRPLFVSPQHRVLLGGWQVELLFGTDQVLVPAKHLLGGGVSQPEPRGTVEYYHLLCDAHEVLLSNGLPTESYQPSLRAVNGLDDGLRGEFMQLFGQRATVHTLSRADAALSLRAHEGRALARVLAA
jgi:hypothetical protein